MQKFRSVKHLIFHNWLTFVKLWIDPKNFDFVDHQVLTVQPVGFLTSIMASLP